MKILILNGSPHLDGAASDMVNAFAEGAREAGHEVVSMNVAHKNIKGCMACEYCRNREKGVCVQKDDMQAIYPEILSADMVVFASPIYYFTLSAQLQAVIHRTYAIDIPQKRKEGRADHELRKQVRIRSCHYGILPVDRGVLGCGKRRNLYGQREAEQVQKEAAGTVSLRKITIEQNPLRKERISRKSCPETMSNL